MSQAIVKPTTEKEILAILGAADDRELLDAAANDDFLPYDIEFQVRADLLAVVAKRNYDNSGLFVTFRVTESNNPEVKVNKRYTIAFFDTHKTLPEFVLKQHLLDKREFAAVVSKNRAEDEAFKSAPVLLKLHRASQEGELGVPMLLQNKFVKRTRNGKNVHHLRFALDNTAAAAE